MALPTLLAQAHHDHISEREADGSWEDCTWDAGLEFYRACYDASKPATHAEAQKLRAASGEPPTGGSNQGNFHAGVKARYGKTLPPPKSGFANLWADLDPRGTGASVQGSMKAFGSGHPLSRYDRNFDGAHDVFVARVDNLPRVWWCDPEGPDTGSSGYNGEWVSKADLAKFVNAFGGQYLVAPLTSRPKEDIMPALTTYLPGFTANIKGESNVRAEPAATATKLRMVPKNIKEPVVLIGTVKGTVDSSNGSDVWYMWWKNGRYEYTAKDNIVDIKAPAVGPTYPDLSKELAQTKVALTVAEQATLAALTKAEGAATAERERLAQVAADSVRKS